MSTVAYDLKRDPPAPVVVLRIEAPGGGPSAVLPGLIDTGADCSLLPATIARDLRLPIIGRVKLQGVAGAAVTAAEHAARVHTRDGRRTCRLVAFGDELLIGRDLLNLAALELDGPRRRGNLRFIR